MELLERDSQLDELHRLFGEVTAGEGRLLFLAGEAGIGKSTLVATFARQVGSRGQVETASFDGFATPDALGPILDIAPALGIPRAALTGGGLTREAIFRRVLDALSFRPRPVVLVGEDAHWADEATLHLVRYIGRRIGSTRVLLIVTYRDDQLEAQHPLRVVMGDLASVPWVQRMSLARLSLDAVGRMAAGHAVDLAELYGLTGGNPFFVAEVLRRNDRELPASVRDAVLGRAARLSLDARITLDAASVVGMRVEPELLSQVLGRPVEVDLDACLAVGVLEVNDRELAFRHAMAWQAVRSSVSPARSVSLNRLVLACLEADPQSEKDHARLAQHADEAHDSSAVLRHAIPAAEHASALSAHREAAAQYARALRFGGGLSQERHAELLEHESLEWYLTGLLDPAILSRLAAIDLWHLIGDRRREGDSLRWLSQMLWFAGRADEGLARGREALALLESLPEGPELAWAYASLSQLHLHWQDPAEAIALGERAIGLAEATGSMEALVHALCTVGAAMDATFGRDGRPRLERSLALAREGGYEDHVARALYNLGEWILHNGAIQPAHDYSTEGLAWCTEHDLAGWEATFLSQRAVIRFEQGDWVGALADADAVLVRVTTRGGPRRGAFRIRFRIEGLRGLDNRVALDEVLGDAERSDEVVRAGRIVEARLMRAEAAWLRGDRDAARQEAEAGYAIVRGTVDAGRGAIATPWAVAEIAVCLARVGGHPDNADHVFEPFRLQLAGDWQAAADRWRELGYPLRTARALMDGDAPAVREALGIFEQLGARPDAQIAKARLRALGSPRVSIGKRTRAASNTAGLTAREIEVLSLIVAGKPDREIAQQLFLSPRTVGHHVSSILAKLEVSSRTAAAAAASRMGIVETRERAMTD